MDKEPKILFGNKVRVKIDWCAKNAVDTCKRIDNLILNIRFQRTIIGSFVTEFSAFGVSMTIIRVPMPILRLNFLNSLGPYRWYFFLNILGKVRIFSSVLLR